MNPVRRLFDDLVEKKLWPAALLLIITAIAVPLLIGGGGSDASSAPDPSVAVAPSNAAAASPAVELVGPPAVRSRNGAVRDPFRRSAPKPEPASLERGGTPAPAASASARTGATSSGTTSGTAKPSGTAKKKSGGRSGSDETPKAAPSIAPTTNAAFARWSYQTVVRFTRPGGTRERPLARLAVLGNAADPALQYLGVGSGRRHAIFVLGSRATISGDGACLVADPCRVIRLRQGEKLGVDVVGKDSVARHYEVEIVRLRPLHMTSAASARAWRARVDPAGRAVLETLAQDPATASVLDRLRYATRTGTVRLVTAA